jgi:hypothetical protein
MLKAKSSAVPLSGLSLLSLKELASWSEPGMSESEVDLVTSIEVGGQDSIFQFSITLRQEVVEPFLRREIASKEQAAISEMLSHLESKKLHDLE